MTTTFTLEDGCPIAWPTNMTINTEYPLIPTGQESAPDLVQRIYLEGLWLPDSIMPVQAVIHTLRRVPSPSTTTTEPHPLAGLLRPLFLSIDRIQTKYGVEIPKLLGDYDPQAERELQPEESMVLFAWHHGKPPPALLNHSGEVVDEERWRRAWMRDAERREVLVQILLHFLCLSLTLKLTPMPLASPLPKKRKQKDHVSAPCLPGSSSSPYKRGRRRKRRLSPPPFSVEDNLDMLTDQVSMWQAVDDDVDKFLKRPNDNDRDWMRVFCEDVVGSIFKDELPSHYAAFKAKLVHVEPQCLTSDDELPAPPKPKVKLKRNASKSTLTEADLAPIHNSVSRERSRSLSIDPSDRRSRSRSVSISAEEIKSIGGKRGGVSSNSRLFASVVDMRKKAGWTRGPSIGSATGEGKVDLVKTEDKKQQSTSLAVSMPSGTTLVVGTPERQEKIAAWISGDDDDFIVDDSPKIQRIQQNYIPASDDFVPESPVKGRR